MLPVVSLPQATGELLAEVVRRKRATAGSLNGWGWRESKVLPVPLFDGLARIFPKVEDTSMIPKTDGDATPLDQRPQSVLPVVYRILCVSKNGAARGFISVLGS